MATQKKLTAVEQEFSQLRRELERLQVEQQHLHKQARELERRNLKLAELNRSKDEFIAIASHQLRTPATGVRQYIGLLLEGYTEPLTPSQALFLEKALQSNDRQLQIIDDLLQVARIDSSSFHLKAEKIDIGRLVAQTIHEMNEKAAERKQKITLHIPKATLTARADTAKLRMVFENLIENAINYSKEDTEISIKLRSSGKYALISITDQGVGIDKEDLPKLFQKFSRVPNPLSVEVGGTGLGLYWAHKIVSLHGGSVEVTSATGKGSTFTIKIPKLK